MHRLVTVLSYLPERWPVAVCLGVLATLALKAGVPALLVFAPLVAAFLVDVATDWLLRRYALRERQRGEALEGDRS